MKKWKQMAARLLTLSVLTAVLAVPVCAGAADIRKADSSAQTYKDGAVVPAAKAPAVRRAAQEKALSDYYITSGKKLDQAVATLLNINPEETGLDPQVEYSYRMDKVLTGDYFYHVRAFHPGSTGAAGDFLLAKDQSCVFRRFPGENRTELLEGTTEKLLEKVEVYPAYKKIPIDGVGKVLIRVPGNIPYNLTLTSLNENMLTIQTDEHGQQWVYGVSRGKADVLAEVEIGNFSTSKVLSFTVMDEKDAAREENRRSGGGFPIGIGIGIGWGHGHHHGHGGGVVIGI
ncbi:MAG: hypothetical protein IJ858_01710 [Acidaminococcaceae bacterium]|nr:hypothetical protein [Acidaminococcaceae bacterium]